MKLSEFLVSKQFEIKPSLGDGHCLLYSVCAAYNNQCQYLQPINKQIVINALLEELNGHLDTYLVFYTRSRSEFLAELDGYIKYKRYNSDIGDIIPNAIANALNIVFHILNEEHHSSFTSVEIHPRGVNNNGSIYIHRKSDHYNGIVYIEKTSSSRITQRTFTTTQCASQIFPRASLAVHRTSPPPRAPLFHQRTSGSPSRAPLFHQRTFGPPPCAPLFHQRTSRTPPCAPPFHQRTSGSPPRAPLFDQRTSPCVPLFPPSAPQSALRIKPCGTLSLSSSCTPRSTNHHEPSLSCERTVYSSHLIRSYRHSSISEQCDRTVRKRLFTLHLWKAVHKRFNVHTKAQRRNNNSTFSLINARSVRNKILYLRDYIDSRNLDIIGLVETWLTKDSISDVTTLTQPGYEMVHFPREDRRGGGVGVMYKSTFKVISKKSITSDAFEAISVVLRSPNATTVRVVVIYRPPASPANIFMDDLCNILHDCSNHPDEIIIAGDFNIHPKQRSNYYSDFLDLLTTNGYTQHVSQSTHVSGNILDLIITPVKSDLVSHVRTESLISDHYAVECDIRCKKPSSLKEKITYRKLKSVDPDQFKLELKLSVAKIDNIDSYNLATMSLVNTHAPTVSRIVTLRDHKPWYSAAIRSEKQKLRSMERKCKQNISLRSLLIKGTQHYRKLLYTTRAAYYKNAFIDANSKTIHSTAAQLMGTKLDSPLPECKSDSILALQFSTYFTDKVTKIHNQIGTPTLDESENVTRSHPSLSRLSCITTSEAVQLLKKSANKACSLDPIPAPLLKDNINVVAPVISKIINISILTGEVPSALKHSVITPIYKKKQLDINELSSYRPVAQLSVVAKVMERHVANQLRHYMESNNIHVTFQSAYRAGHSTETALVKIHNDITCALSRHRKVIMVLLDLSSAFDTLDHRILLRRLSAIGLTDNITNWFKSYLCERTTTVKIRSANSPSTTCCTGVPQGSVLGPLLFNIYCLPLAAVIDKHGLSYHMYADDTQLYLDFSPDSESTVHSRIATCVNDIKAWLSDNMLLLNENKTEAITIASQNDKTSSRGSIKLGNVSIPMSHSIRDLGVIIDKECTMEKHAAKVCSNANYYLQCIRKIRDCIDRDTCKILVHSLVTSRLDYGNPLLHNAPQKVINRLERVQRSSARLICLMGRRQRVSMTEVLHDLHWLPVSARVKYKILVLTFRALRSGTPSYLSDLVVKYTSIRSTRLQTNDSADHLVVPLYSGERTAGTAFSVVAPKLWNELPSSVSSIKSVDTFKKKLKTHLFSQYYYGLI